MSQEDVVTVLSVVSLSACIIGLVLGLADNAIHRRRVRRLAAAKKGV